MNDDFGALIDGDGARRVDCLRLCAMVGRVPGTPFAPNRPTIISLDHMLIAHSSLPTGGLPRVTAHEVEPKRSPIGMPYTILAWPSTGACP
jgi:hypothetical protein